jgi:hypothetical protein
MGFLVNYKYCKLKDGSYDKSELTEGNIKVGEAFDEVPLDILAGKVMALLARRAIFVTEIEIFELARKAVSYKESDDGILIKNKKFRFDDGVVQQGTELPEVVQEVAQPVEQAQVAPKPRRAKEKILRFETYSPEIPELLQEDRKRGFAFTKGKNYPIYTEQVNGPLVIYTTDDDNGRRVGISDKSFVPVVKMEDFSPDSRSGDLPLSYGSSVRDEVPVLRGR